MAEGGAGVSECKVLDSKGPFSLSYRGYYEISRETLQGGKHAISYGQDEAKARAAWAALWAKPLCRECGEPELSEYIPETQRQIEERQLCFSCNFWTNKLEEFGADHFVADGCLYRIRPDAPIGYRGFVGHGGAEFTVEYPGGQQRTTKNLWAAGPVPEHFRDRFPDTARFVTRPKGCAYVGAGSALA